MTNKNTSKVMYLGPNIRGVVKHGAVFEGGIPDRLSRLAEKKPIVRTLIVPLSEIVTVKTAMMKEGTVEAIAYGKIKAISVDDINTITKGE